ncbi:MAG TPA: TonB-dependent receptor, partial [Cyclobacteriaceae bacterium]|nr:TonB-dependent receptor [Cyclobacteriaceae bacterium]
KGVTNNKTVSVTARVQEETAGDEYHAFTGKGIHNESVYTKWQGRRFHAGLGVTRNLFGGLTGNKEGRVKEWLPKDQYMASGSFGYANDRVDVWYRLDYLNESLVSPGAPNANTHIAVDKEYLTNRFTHQLQANWTINDSWSFNAAGSYQDYTRRTRTTLYNDVTHEVNLSPEPGTQDESAFTSTTLRGTFLYKLTDHISLQPGFDVNHNKGMGERIDHEREIGDYALFASAEIKSFGFLNIRPGLRFIYNTAYNAPPVIPSLNLKAKLSPVLDLRAAYAHGFRAPALRELYFYFFDASHSIKGNPDLEAEYSNSYTASLVWHALTKQNTDYTSTFGVFYNDFRNMIAYSTPDEAGTTTYINVNQYKTLGVSVNNTFRYKALRANLGLMHIGVYNELSEDDASLPEIMWTPEINTSLTYQFEKTGTSLAVFYKYTGKVAVYQWIGNSISLAER